MTSSTPSLFAPPNAHVGEVDGRQIVLDFGDAAAEHTALTRSAALADLSHHTQLEIRGRDRALLLNNLCTNDIKALKHGEGCEAFVTNVQGKTIGFIQVYCTEETLIVETTAGQAEHLLAHFEKYHLREDVSFTDRSSEWFELCLAGPKSADVLQKLAAERGSDKKLSSTLPAPPFGHAPFTLQVHQLFLRRSNYLAGDCFVLAGPRAELPSVWQLLTPAGAVPCGFTALEAARIESGTPRFGIDLSEKNLPQEVARDKRAIHFQKGCYLGQETVARLDALGHVNQLLCGVEFAGKEMPPNGMELNSGGKPIGKVTSSAWSYRLNSPLSLVYLRRQFAQVGQALDSTAGPCKVVALPLA